MRERSWMPSSTTVMSISSIFSFEDEDIIDIESFSSENDEEMVRELHEFEYVNTDTASVEYEGMLAGLAGTSSSGSEDGEVVREVGEVEYVNDIIGIGHDHHDIEEEVFDPLPEVPLEEDNTDETEVVELSQDERD